MRITDLRWNRIKIAFKIISQTTDNALLKKKLLFGEIS